MSTLARALFLAGLGVAAGCTDESTAPTAPSLPRRTVTTTLAAKVPPTLGVGTMGVVVDLKPNDRQLVVEQIGFNYTPPPGSKYRDVEQQFAVGSRKNRLQVHVRKDTTKIYLKDRDKPLDSLAVGDTILVVGQVTGSSLHADMITDLRRLDRADSTINKLPEDEGEPDSPPAVSSGIPGVSATSLCLGQDLDYSDPNVLEFHGCWGGPNASDDINMPFIPLFCPLVGCFGIDRFSYTMALGGWTFAFPYRFKAETAQPLVYHVPGNVSLAMEPLSATTGAFSFSGGLGFEFGLNIDFCSFFGCYDIYTFRITAFSMIHQATGAGPLEGRMDIAETSCPSIGLIPVDGIPIDPLSIGLCEDLGLNGRAFNSTVKSSGANPGVWARYGFTNASKTVQLRPDAMQVGMRFDDFAWAPYMTMGLYFSFAIFDIDVYSTPSINFGEIGPFYAVPLGSEFTVATDPLSPPDDLRYLYQPTFASLALSVAPAPTVVDITSAGILAEGTPVTVRLSEKYDASSIAGRAIAIQANGLGGTESVSLSATTNAEGVASLVLPIGEYAVAASYAGGTTYLPSSDEMTPVYVYRPTTFVIWGGNDGGVAVGARYQFWGSGWAKQVSGGSYGGNSSFQGFAVPTSATAWTSPPASSGRGPESVPDMIGVIVTTDVQDRGSKVTGNIAGYAVLRIDDPAAYRSDGGHAASGVVRAQLP